MPAQDYCGLTPVAGDGEGANSGDGAAAWQPYKHQPLLRSYRWSISQSLGKVLLFVQCGASLYVVGYVVRRRLLRKAAVPAPALKSHACNA